MDLLAQHEAFLRAIYDAPDDDTPRLVYADFLEENGDPDRAAYIRYDCAHARLRGEPAQSSQWGVVNLALANLRREQPPGWPWDGLETDRGFPRVGFEVVLRSEELQNVTELRNEVVRHRPGWFRASALRVYPGDKLSVEAIETALGLLFVQQVSSWNLGGYVEESSVVSESNDIEGLPRLIDFRVMPAVTSGGVDLLAHHRAARRIIALDLRNNNLDNDAARALVKSPYLDNLKRLQLLEGNRLRGRVWQQVIERFGEDVVG